VLNHKVSAADRISTWQTRAQSNHFNHTAADNDH
jgi:hypothetical protein